MSDVLVDSNMMEAWKLAGKNTRRKGWEEETVVSRKYPRGGWQGGRKADVQRDGPVSWAQKELKFARAQYRARGAATRPCSGVYR
jgi:hypothetical protein